MRPNTHLDREWYWDPREVDFEVRRLLSRIMRARHGRPGVVQLFTPRAQGLEAGIEFLSPDLGGDALEIQTFNTFEDLLIYYLTEATAL